MASNPHSWSRITLAAVIALCAAGCVKEFDPPSKLGDNIQVLAIQATPPEIKQAESVDLQALVYVPADWPHPLDALWLICVPDVGESTQACLETVFAQLSEPMFTCELQCTDDPDPQACMEACLIDQMVNFLCQPGEVQKGCVAGYGGRAGYELPQGSFPNDGDPHAFFVFMMATALPNGLSGCFDIWADQVVAGNPMGPTKDCTLSLKRVTALPEDEEPASNPALESLHAEGELIPNLPDALPVELTDPDPEDNPLELEVVMDATTLEFAQNEDVFLSWFTDCGSLSKSRTFGDDPENTLKPDRTGLCRLYVVIRDGERGVGWLERHLDLLPPAL